MDPSKNIGQIKEQVEREHIARRRYPKKWGKLIEPEVTKFYNQNEINRQLKDSLVYQDLCPFQYTGEGESYFVSRELYDSLCSKCRCGRPSTEAHIIRCLQKEHDRYAPLPTRNESSMEGEQAERNNLKIPTTSNGAVGFVKQKPVYQKWEQSMKYISPVYTMPGFRVTARPYNAIIIG